MIKRTDLVPAGIPGIRFSGEAAKIVRADVIQLALQNRNEEAYSLPVEVTIDQVKSGGLFNSTVEDCVIIKNVDHPSDYFRYCLLIQEQGQMVCVSIYYYGISVLTAKANQTEARKGSLGGMFINAMVGVNQAAYDAEYQYYSMLDSLIGEVLN